MAEEASCSGWTAPCIDPCGSAALHRAEAGKSGSLSEQRHCKIYVTVREASLRLCSTAQDRGREEQHAASLCGRLLCPYNA